jgi:hypothetical protein
MPWAAAVGALLLTACQPADTPRPPRIDQSAVCNFDNDTSAQRCKDGQLAFFQPATFGNEQLPLVVASAYCDFAHPIMHNRGGVLCVMTHQRSQASAH